MRAFPEFFSEASTAVIGTTGFFLFLYPAVNVGNFLSSFLFFVNSCFLLFKKFHNNLLEFYSFI